MITLPDHKRGDTWRGMTIVIRRQDTDGTILGPLDLTGAEFLAQVRKTHDGPTIMEWSSADGTLTADTESGAVMVPAGVIDMAPGSYLLDLQVTLEDGTVMTPFEARWKIIPDISRPNV